MLIMKRDVMQEIADLKACSKKATGSVKDAIMSILRGATVAIDVMRVEGMAADLILKIEIMIEIEIIGKDQVHQTVVDIEAIEGQVRTQDRKNKMKTTLWILVLYSLAAQDPDHPEEIKGTEILKVRIAPAQIINRSLVLTHDLTLIQTETMLVIRQTIFHLMLMCPDLT